MPSGLSIPQVGEAPVAKASKGGVACPKEIAMSRTAIVLLICSVLGAASVVLARSDLQQDRPLKTHAASIEAAPAA
jgi:hypothetical protein